MRTDVVTGKKLYVSEAEAVKIDMDLKNIAFTKRWISKIGVSIADFNAHKKKMSKTSGSIIIRNKDVIWSILGRKLHNAAYAMDFSTMSRINYKQALFLNEEGKDARKLLTDYNKNQLLAFKNDNLITHVEIIAGDKSCSNCQKNIGIELSLDEAIAKQPLPCKECEFILENGKFPFCRCMYADVIKR